MKLKKLVKLTLWYNSKQSSPLITPLIMRLDPKAFALACGSTWAIGVILLALISLFADGYGSSVISLISTVYRGYRPDIPGAIIGGIWGFADGAIGGYILAWFYNKFLQS